MSTSVRFCLLQARGPSDPVRHEERVSFAARLQVPVEQIRPYDLLAGDATLEAVTADTDLILVGGSGEYSVYDDVPWMTPFLDTLGALADAGFPTFASCFGFQGLVVALGGQVRKDDPSAEVGTYRLARESDADDDPVFGDLPDSFWAQLGHKDRAMTLPSGVTNLVRSERCPYQAIRVGDGPVYATQFHPELTGDENRARFERYLKLYSKAFGADKAQEMLDDFQASPATEGLLKRYVDVILK